VEWKEKTVPFRCGRPAFLGARDEPLWLRLQGLIYLAIPVGVRPPFAALHSLVSRRSGSLPIGGFDRAIFTPSSTINRYGVDVKREDRSVSLREPAFHGACGEPPHACGVSLCPLFPVGVGLPPLYFTLWCQGDPVLLL
jgi:hypothetical protein